MNKILEEVLRLTTLKKNEGEPDQKFLFRLVIALDDILEKETTEELWNSLLSSTKKWLNSAILAIGENKTIPIIPGVTKQNVIITGNSKEIEETNTSVFASTCERGKYYKIDVNGKIFIAECVRVSEDKVIFEDGLNERYMFFPFVKVIPINEDEVQLNFNRKEDGLEEQFSAKIDLNQTRERAAGLFIRRLICKDPFINKDAIMSSLAKAGYAKMSYLAVHRIVSCTKRVIKILKELGHYVESPVSTNKTKKGEAFE